MGRLSGPGRGLAGDHRLSHRPICQLTFPEEYRAVLFIGDRALQFSKHNRQWVDSLDLGAAWRETTGLPIVYALWLCRRDIEMGPGNRGLERSLPWGEDNFAE